MPTPQYDPLLKTKYFTVSQFADLVRLHYNTVLKWVKSGKLKSVRVGKSWRIPDGEIYRFINSKGK